jgi:hypothetical protein
VLPTDSPAADALKLAGVIEQLRASDTLQEALGSGVEIGVEPGGTK